MRALIQRVSRAAVTVDDVVVAAIPHGLVILIGATHDDTPEDAVFLAGKIANLRIFPDQNGAMNRSALDLLGEGEPAIGMLVVSQFTLYADVKKGRRPSFVAAARPEQAEPLVTRFADALRDLGLPVQTGRFGAHMHVELVNDGPVTIWLDTAALR